MMTFWCYGIISYKDTAASDIQYIFYFVKVELTSGQAFWAFPMATLEFCGVPLNGGYCVAPCNNLLTSPSVTSSHTVASEI